MIDFHVRLFKFYAFGIIVEAAGILDLLIIRMNITEKLIKNKNRAK